MKTQVIIVGKGIAGLVLSTLLERQEIDHVLLFRRETHSPIALGETIPPSAMPLLKTIGLYSLFENTAYGKTRGYHAIWGSHLVNDHHFYQQSSNAHGLKINKSLLLDHLTQMQEHRLLEVKSIAQVTTARGVNMEVSGLQKKLKIEGDLVVDATGRKRAVLKMLKVASRLTDQQIALSCHLPAKHFEQLPYGVFIESFPGGWGIVSALSKEVNVMTLFPQLRTADRQRYNDFSTWGQLLRSTQGLRHYLPEPSLNVPHKVVGYDASSTLAQNVGGAHWMAIGDAAMSFDPLSSHGVTNAIWTANRVAKIIVQASGSLPESEVADYQRQIEEIFHGYSKAKAELYKQKDQWEAQVSV